jgi:hypothetical protein
MALSYFELVYVDVKGACAVEYFSNREFAWDLSIGKSLAEVWPTDMSIDMSPEHPKDVALIDNLSNREAVLLIATHVCDFLNKQNVPDLEFLPVTVRDHKKRIASKDYRVLNCLRVIDCVDQEKSAFRWDGLEEPSMVMRKMVVNVEAVSDSDRLLRPRFVPAVTLFREDLVHAILAQKFSGVAFSRKLFGDSKVLRAPK